MASDNNSCIKCSRKIMQSISNRCMYCGADLPEVHHLTAAEKAALFSEKFERFRQNRENAEEINSNLRRDFGLPGPKKSRKQRKQDNEAAITAAIAATMIGNNGGGSNNCGG